MKLEILLSCMHQRDNSIFTRSKIESDVLIVNQCYIDRAETTYHKDKFGSLFSVRMISTKERGLSRSRNMALKHTVGDICLLADDDEEFVEGYASKIQNIYNLYPKADVIAFSLVRGKKTYPSRFFRLNYLTVLRISSPQITFRKLSVKEKGITFDETMGSGTGNGGGEENKFLYDCLRSGLRVYYCPIVIATVKQSESQWFHGFTSKYFVDKGWAHKKIKGHFLGLITVIRFVIIKYPLYRKEMKFGKALLYVVKGVFENR